MGGCTGGSVGAARHAVTKAFAEALALVRCSGLLGAHDGIENG